MEIFVLVLMLALGSICIYLGYRLWFKEEITLMHDYHYAKVKEQDKKIYTEKMGKAMILLGSGIALTGIICFTLHTGYGWIICVICIIISFTIMLSTQNKYNR